MIKMNQKIILESKNVEIHFDKGIETDENHAYAIYVFCGDVLIGSNYGTYDNMKSRFESIKEKLSFVE